MITVSDLVQQIAAQFERAPLHYGHGTDNAWDEAVRLVTFQLGLPDDQAVLAQVVSEGDSQQVQALADARISSRKPLAYLLGSAPYAGFEFHITEGVVIPRSPIGLALLAGELDGWLQAPVQRVLDLCSGSGCLGILSAQYFPQAEVTLLENDPLAQQVCAANIERYQLSNRVTCLAADIFQPWPLDGHYDLVLANPPYVDQPDMQSLPAEYAHEPTAGLASGADGLSHMRAILTQLPNHLTEQGLFVGEVGASGPALNQAYPKVPVVWLDLPQGGEGVFVLEGRSLLHHTAPADSPAS